MLSRIAESEPQRRLVAFVLESDSAHMPASARATLVASLRCVDLVASGTRNALPQENARLRVVSDPDADQQHSQRFVQLVLERQKAGS